MKQDSALQLSTWGLTSLVVILGITAWTGTVSLPLSIGDIFPLLGILAFSLMWTHYTSGTLRRWFKQSPDTLKTYFNATALVVLVLILLHPGLFYLQLYLDGFGIPPQSYLDAYPDAVARFALFLGTMSLIVFLAFELKRKFGESSWWKYVEYTQIVAMFAIFYHALTLGGDLMGGWFRAVWFAYGILLIASLVYNYWYDRRQSWIKNLS